MSGRNTLVRRAVGVLIFFALPISVSAALVGAITSIFTKENPALKILHNNTIQTMAILASDHLPFSKSDHNPIVQADTLVSESGPGGVGPSMVHKPANDQISIYVVREGDTLSEIARMFDVSVNTIKWGNNLSSNSLTKGTRLIILPISGVKYTVKKGDTLKSIAKIYRGDINEIVSYNNLDANSPLTAGTEIIIPDGELTAPLKTTVKFPAATGLKEYAGYYLRPIVGGTKTQGIHGNNGVDLASTYGSAILASADGEVIISKMGGWNGGYGNYIVLKHDNGTQTLYAHLSQTFVSVGSTVKQGDIIGAMGQTGKATGVHLHFEIRGAKNPF